MVTAFVTRWIFQVISFLSRRLNTKLIYFIRFEAVVCAAGLLGIPLMYEDNSTRFCTALFGLFLILQIVMNLICIRNVKSVYDVKKYGQKPDDNINEVTNEHTSVPEFSRTKMTSSPKQTSFKYFSWTYCLTCDRARPPRCHHCHICKECILKRDHHCFFAGSCIGFQNYRHFTVFLFWVAVASIYKTFHMLLFYNKYVLPNSSICDLFIPYAALRALFGLLEWKYVLYLCHGFFILSLIVWDLYTLKSVACNIYLGLTKFEKDCDIKITDMRPLSGKLRSIFGQYWMLNFIVPLHVIYEPVDNPLTWPSIKVPH